MLKLSSQQYAGVVTALQIAAESGGSDKRQFTRMQVQAPVRLAVMADAKLTRCYIAVTRDVSLGGIGVCQAHQFAPNEHFLISLPFEKNRVVVVCSTTFCRPLADGIFRIGAQFDSEAGSTMLEEFRALAAASVKAA